MESKRMPTTTDPNILKNNIRIVALYSPVPSGWVTMTVQQGKAVANYLRSKLGAWSIVAFQNGKLDGSGYGSVFSNSYGSQCGQKFIINEEILQKNSTKNNLYSGNYYYDEQKQEKTKSYNQNYTEKVKQPQYKPKLPSHNLQQPKGDNSDIK